MNEILYRFRVRYKNSHYKFLKVEGKIIDTMLSIFVLSTFEVSHKQKSSGVRSGDLGGYSIDPLHPIHLSGKTLSKWFLTKTAHSVLVLRNLLRNFKYRGIIKVSSKKSYHFIMYFSRPYI